MFYNYFMAGSRTYRGTMGWTITPGQLQVVLFFWLLWTAVAMASQSDQSLGCPPVTNLRYFSTHWFFHSESPSVWGWEAVNRFCWIPSHLVSAFPKCEVNLGSLSLMTFLGSPYYELMWLRYNYAIPTLEMWVEHGKNSATLERPWSTIVRMV